MEKEKLKDEDFEIVTAKRLSQLLKCSFAQANIHLKDIKQEYQLKKKPLLYHVKKYFTVI